MNTDNKKREVTAAERGHVEADAPDRVPGYILIPGDPNRVVKMAQHWEDVSEYTLARRHALATGKYKGTELGAWATGMGGGSAEIVISDIYERGAHTLIRVGTTGAIQPGINVGDIIINDASVRLDGTSDMYVMKGFPASASHEVTLALIAACESLGFTYHVGTGCTCASFYTGQCRPAYGGYKPSFTETMFSDLREAGVLNFEMEAATVMTLSRLFGKRCGMCATVVAQRLTGEWDEDPAAEERACLAGMEAVRILFEWDSRKTKAGKKYFFPGL